MLLTNLIVTCYIATGSSCANGNAVCFCILGAVLKCYHDESKTFDIVRKMQSKVNVLPHIWNDTPERTFEDVKKLVEELDI